MAVGNTRGGISKASMIHNSLTPKIDVNPETYDVRADGELLTCEPATSCRWRSAISCTDHAARHLRPAERSDARGRGGRRSASPSIIQRGIAGAS